MFEVQVVSHAQVDACLALAAGGGQGGEEGSYFLFMVGKVFLGLEVAGEASVGDGGGNGGMSEAALMVGDGAVITAIGAHGGGGTQHLVKAAGDLLIPPRNAALQAVPEGVGVDGGDLEEAVACARARVEVGGDAGACLLFHAGGEDGGGAGGKEGGGWPRGGVRSGGGFSAGGSGTGLRGGGLGLLRLQAAPSQQFKGVFRAFFRPLQAAELRRGGVSRLAGGDGEARQGQNSGQGVRRPEGALALPAHQGLQPPARKGGKAGALLHEATPRGGGLCGQAACVCKGEAQDAAGHQDAPGFLEEVGQLFRCQALRHLFQEEGFYRCVCPREGAGQVVVRQVHIQPAFQKAVSAPGMDVGRAGIRCFGCPVPCGAVCCLSLPCRGWFFRGQVPQGGKAVQGVQAEGGTDEGVSAPGELFRLPHFPAQYQHVVLSEAPPAVAGGAPSAEDAAGVKEKLVLPVGVRAPVEGSGGAVAQGVKGAHQLRAAPVGGNGVVVRHGVAGIGHEEAGGGAGDGSSGQGELAKDQVLCSGGGDALCEGGGDQPLHGLAGEHVARAAAGGVAGGQQRVSGDAVAVIGQIRQAGEVQVGVIVALEQPVKVMVVQGVAEEGEDFLREGVIGVRGVQSHGVGALALRDLSAQEEEAFHVRMGAGKPGLAHGVTTARVALGGADADQDFVSRRSGCVCAVFGLWVSGLRGGSDGLPVGKLFQGAEQNGAVPGSGGSVPEGRVVHGGQFPIGVVQHPGFLIQQPGADRAVEAVGEDDICLVEPGQKEGGEKEGTLGIMSGFIGVAGEVEGLIPAAHVRSFLPGFRVCAQHEQDFPAVFCGVQALPEPVECVAECGVGGDGVRGALQQCAGIQREGHVVCQQEACRGAEAGQVEVAALLPAEDGEPLVKGLRDLCALVEGAGQDDGLPDEGMAQQAHDLRHHAVVGNEGAAAAVHEGEGGAPVQEACVKGLVWEGVPGEPFSGGLGDYLVAEVAGVGLVVEGAKVPEGL